MDIMAALRVRDIMIEGRSYVSFQLATPTPELLRRVSDASWQDVFPVLDGSQKMAGMITSDMLRILAMEHELSPLALAADAMQPAVTVRPEDDLRTATQAMLTHGVREVPVVDENGRIVGFLDEADVGKAYLEATRSAVPR
jgi:CIC family chloride channel protein